MLPFSSRSAVTGSKSHKSAANRAVNGTARRTLHVARVQPRFLLLAMLFAIGGTTWWAVAQNDAAQVIHRAVNPKGTQQKTKAFSLKDLPSLVQNYGLRRQLEVQQAQSAAPLETSTAAAVTTKAVTTKAVTTKAFALTEVDLTAGNVSDEREPAVRPSGDFIAFVSNGVDNVNNTTGVTGADGKIDPNTKLAQYHIWIMRRNGSGQRQVTGLGADSARSQRRPSWSPDGNRLVYVDGTGNTSQLYFVSPFATDAATGKPPFQQITFFSGEKRSPAWGPAGVIAFACNTVPNANGTSTPTTNNNFDIFTIDPSGTLVTIRRLTGGTSDAVGNTTDDLNPAFSLTNVGVLFFSSNRDRGVRIAGRRIFSMGTIDGSNKRQVTDPVALTTGNIADVDDNPSPSLTQSFNSPYGSARFTERLAFERNSLVDASDVTRDLNIWSLAVTSSSLAPPPTAPAATLTVSGFNGNTVRDYDATAGILRRQFVTPVLTHPEDVIYGPDFTGDGYPDLLVANRDRGAGTVELFDGVSSRYLRTVVQAGASGLTNPTGLTIGPDGALYIASGSGDTVPAASTSANAVFRVFLNTVGTVPQVPVRFTSAGAGITNGIEGIAFGPDASGDGFSDLYVSALSDNKVAVFDGLFGIYISDFVAANAGGLTTPTGLIFGRDINGDGRNDLFVASGGAADAIKVFDAVTGTFLSNFVSNDATMNAPERLTFGPDANGDSVPELYVSVFNGGVGGTVNRYNGRTGTPLPAAGQLGATFVSDAFLQGATGLAFNPVATGAYNPQPTNLNPVETRTAAGRLETNLLTSPTGVTKARYTGAVEDKSADREPSFARSNTTSQSITQLVFASQRTTAAAPSTNPANPRPAIVNPGGGPQFVVGSNPPRLSTFTHDIWTTGVQDFTPPTLIPVAVGGQLYPALAPGPQAPFTAPRTVEEGLTPGGKLTVGFVIQDLESGLASARVEFKDADQPQFRTQDEGVDLAFPTVEVAVEQQPIVVSSINPVTGRPLTLRIYDNGPLSAGGNERQQNAIAGDGTYYVEASFNTVDDAGLALTGDYYIDLYVTDNAGNAFTYDNVFGFSTKAFAKNNKVLLVSDYTVGQYFPLLLQSSTPNNFARANSSAQAVESYYLTNPGGTFLANLPQDLDIPASGAADTTTLGTFSVQSEGGQEEFTDVWRILCRGPIPLDRMLLYSPQITEQLRPGFNPDGDIIPGPYRQTDGSLYPDSTRQVAVSNSCIVWASPYTGSVFAAPGTLYDGATQRDISAFLNTGGRLIISGQDIAFALTNNGTTTNDFLTNELKAGFGGEINTNVINGTGDGLVVNGGAAGADPPRTINISFRETALLPAGFLFENDPGAISFGDAARNQLDMDVLVPQAATAGETVTTLYNYGGGGVAGQRIEKTRANGLESRVVFFGFGFEAVHRGYRANPTRCINVRSKIFYNATRIYFNTGGISGRVFSAATNQPIPKFLVEVVDGGGNQIYIAETDENGEYEIIGMPFGNYNVRPLQYNDAGVVRSGNGSYFPGPAQPGIAVSGGRITRDINFRVQPAPPGSISGRAISDKGTTDIADDANGGIEPAVFLPVLIRSVRPLKASAAFPQGGTFAAITVTDSAGNFTFRNVPSNELFELVFNPLPGFTNATDVTKRGDIPPNSNIVYPNPDPNAQPQVNTKFERRVIPVDPRYGRDFTNPAIRTFTDTTGTRSGFLIPIGQNLNIGDVPVPPGNGPDPGTGSGTTTDDFQVGSIYMISIPWMDTSSTTATTTPGNAFTLPPTNPTTGEANYRLTKFDPLTQTYVALTNSSLLRRGEGYFIRPLAKPVSFRRPGASPARVPLPATVTTFTVTLRRSSSLAATDPNNGFNLIGFPFNPTNYRSVNWTVASVYVPSTGARYSSVTAAAAAGVMSSTLFTLADTTGTSYTTGTKMVALKGYFAKTFVDNVQVTMVASTTP